MASSSGPQTTLNNIQNKGTENFCRLCQLIITICSDLFRDIISYYIRPSDLRSKLDRKKAMLLKLKCTNDQQKKSLFPGPGDKPTVLEDLDICVLYVLLRNVCNIKPHQNKWGKRPNTNDNSIVACIEKIRLKRNAICGHINKGSIDDIQFHKYWNELKTDIVQIKIQFRFTYDYEKAVDELLSCDLNPTTARLYVEKYKEIEDNLKIKRERMDGVEDSLLLTKHHMAVKGERMDEMESCLILNTHHMAEKKENVENIANCCEELKGKVNQLENKTKENQDKQEKSTTMIRELQDKLEKSTTMIGELQDKQEKMTTMIRELEDKQEKMTTMIRELQERLNQSEIDGSTQQGSMSRPIISTFLSLTSTIAVPGVSYISHIAFVKSGSLWAGECKVLKQIDFSGKVIQVIYDAKCNRGDFTVTENGDLFYVQIGSKRVLKKLDIGTMSILDTADKEEILCIHSSRINGDLLVGIKSISTDTCKITRYDKTGKKIQDIELYKGKRLYRDPSYITENINRDIVTSDFLKKSVVVVDKSGQYRFDYSGHDKNTEFLPCGVCTDDFGHIFVISCFENNIHVFDQNGLFLNLILDKHAPFIDWGLCVGDKHIYIGHKNGEIKVFKSLKTQR